MQIKLKISYSVNHKKGPFCLLRTKAYFMKNVPLLIRNNPASVCPSNNSIIAPDKLFPHPCVDGRISLQAHIPPYNVSYGKGFICHD